LVADAVTPLLSRTIVAHDPTSGALDTAVGEMPSKSADFAAPAFRLLPSAFCLLLYLPSSILVAASTCEVSALITSLAFLISASTSSHCFSSIASRTPGIVLTPYPV